MEPVPLSTVTLGELELNCIHCNRAWVGATVIRVWFLLSLATWAFKLVCSLVTFLGSPPTGLTGTPCLLFGVWNAYVLLMVVLRLGPVRKVAVPAAAWPE